jgi:nucleoid-associated protein YgaU
LKGRFVTANESETSAIQPDPGAEDELWLTYLNYDQRVGQAVRRLGALSPENVDLFRGLLLKSRDRSKVKEYEAESIRRLQGEAFVGDEELQRTLIVLSAEDPRFGEELKRLVGAKGKPAQLDQTVAAIRSGNPGPLKPIETVAKETAREIPKEPVKEPAEDAVKETIKEAVVVPLRKEQAAPRPVLDEAVRRENRKPAEQHAGEEKRNLKPLAIAAVVLVAAVGLVLLVPGLIGGKSARENQVAAAPTPSPAAEPQANASSPAPHPPAPGVDISMPAQADKGGPSSPPLRPASAQPDAAASNSAASQPDVRSAPVAGGRYRVMKGDMLSDIALQVYGDASKFRLIQAANPSIRNKDHILVDQVIFVPPNTP